MYIISTHITEEVTHAYATHTLMQILAPGNLQLVTATFEAWGSHHQLVELFLFQRIIVLPWVDIR